ncbi:MAG: hypothetical protein H0X24_00695 [Ktedonobacterales bacterium]|nr:hypothetical protein [Ktedonobacterales bacterium]
MTLQEALQAGDGNVMQGEAPGYPTPRDRYFEVYFIRGSTQRPRGRFARKKGFAPGQVGYHVTVVIGTAIPVSADVSTIEAAQVIMTPHQPDDQQWEPIPIEESARSMTAGETNKKGDIHDRNQITLRDRD